MQLELRGITKRFGSLTANDQISLKVEPGQIHSLLGENGAGKSTLMNVLFGLLHPDDGEILINGEVVQFHDSGEAVRRGIGMVHQHFMLVPVFTVAENVVLGFEPTKSLNRVDYKKATEDIRRLSQQFKLEVDPHAVIENLPVGLQQRVEILKALSHDAELLILDEPTAVLTPQEIDALMAIMRSLADAGKSILFITHKLKEVKAIADVITVIRLGRVVGTAEPSASETELASLMVGRDVQLVVEKSDFAPGTTCSRFATSWSSTTAASWPWTACRWTCARAKCSPSRACRATARPSSSRPSWGCVTSSRARSGCNGTDITNLSPRQALDAGIGHIPEDRQRDGLVLSMSVADNLVLNTPRAAPFARRGTTQSGGGQRQRQEAVGSSTYARPPSKSPTGSLSGGNQQKVIVARELSRDPEFLVASQPTRGLDVGSIEYVHDQIIEFRNRGKGSLIVSSELDEVFALGDRIAVMYEGPYQRSR